MSNPEQLSLHGRHLLNRRGFLGTSGLSAAGLGLTALLCKEGLLAETSTGFSGKTPIRPDIDPKQPSQLHSIWSWPIADLHRIQNPGAFRGDSQATTKLPGHALF